MSAVTRSLLCLALVFVAVTAAQAQVPNPGREALVAARYAVTGRNLDDIKVFGHGFNVYAARITESRGVATISGRIAHRLRLRPDDEVRYVIKKQGDKVLDVQIQIIHGGVMKLVGKVMGLMTGNLAGMPITGDSMLGQIASKLDGSWEDSAEFIVAAIAVKARAGGSAPYDPNNNRPNVGKPSPPPAVSGGVVVRDHREPTFASGGVVVRDHRKPTSASGGVVIRDHRK
jgi:hypothetical protein